jgi:peptidyl-tRNA hydrolase
MRPRNFTRELEQQRATARAIEERHAGEMKRVLLDVDRERGNAGKLQKEVEQMRRETASQAEAHRQEVLDRQQQLDALRQRNGELEGRAAELLEQRDLQARELEAMRQRMEAAAPGVLQAPEPRNAARRSPSLRRPRPDLEAANGSPRGAAPSAKIPLMKMYILVRDDIPLGFAMVAVAHASLAGYLRFKDEPEVREWLAGPFFKAVCKVNAKEFENAKHVADHVVLTESALGDRRSRSSSSRGTNGRRCSSS